MTAPLAALDAAAAAFTDITGILGRPVTIDVKDALHRRAELMGLTPRGRTSMGGSCRLLQGPDGWAAVSLARPDDIASVPAITGEDKGGDIGDDPWGALGSAASAGGVATVVERARLLGVPAAVLGESAGLAPYRTSRLGQRAPTPATPVVVDLSAMWAGPLCSHLLGRAGARVVGVEDPARPDASRTGSPEFFDWLHAGHERVSLDLRSPDGIDALRALLTEADIVIESSRPRALRQLGIDADEVVAARPGVTWVSITGYGRDGAAGGLVAFGDDAAVAGGLVDRNAGGDPVFRGDAIADPVTGIYAAVAAVASLAAGGGNLVDVAMAGAAAHVAARAGISAAS